MKFSLKGVKPTRFTGIALIVLGALLLVWVVLTLATGMQSTRSGPAKIDPNHCPDCGREYSRQAMGTKECSYCKLLEQSGEAKPRRKAGSWGGGTTIPIVLVCSIVLIAVVHLTLAVRARLNKAVEEVLYYTNCRKCDRRLRYRERQAGHYARCPICKTVLRFPELDRGTR